MTMFNSGKNDDIYHIGMDRERSIKDLLNDMANLLGINVEIFSGKKPKGGTSRRCPDINKIISIGYKRKDHYYKGLEKTINWYKDYYTNHYQNGENDSL